MVIENRWFRVAVYAQKLETTNDFRVPHKGKSRYVRQMNADAFNLFFKVNKR